MILFSIFSILIGIILFIVGLNTGIEILMIIAGMVISLGVLLVVSYLASYNKSDSEKKEIYDNVFDQYSENMTRGFDYTLFKMSIGDKINKDIQKDIKRSK